MKKLLSISLAFTLIACTSTVIADSFFVCPNTYKSVNAGDSMAQVTAACGKPSSTQSKVIQGSKPLQLQQWVYVKQGVILNNNNNKQIFQQNQDLQPRLTITFKGNRVMRIESNRTTNTNLFPCYRMKRVVIGSTANDVKFACGLPNAVNTIQQSVPMKEKITLWLYKFGAYKPTRIFVFKNGQLKEIKMGQMEQPQ